MGQCSCADGWEGPACECPKSNQTCMDSKGVNGADTFQTLNLLLTMPNCVFMCASSCVVGGVNASVAAASVQTLVSRCQKTVSQTSRCVDISIGLQNIKRHAAQEKQG